jgi:hypothetical protein
LVCAAVVVRAIALLVLACVASSYRVLQNRSTVLSRRDPIPEELQRALKEDPSEMVSLLARKVFRSEED